MTKTVELVSSDGVRFSGVDVDVAGKCNVLKTRLQEIVHGEGKEQVILVLDDVTGDVLEFVVKWIENHPVMMMKYIYIFFKLI